MPARMRLDFGVSLSATAGDGAGVELALKLRTVVCAASLSSSLTGPTGFPSTSWRWASGCVQAKPGTLRIAVGPNGAANGSHRKIRLHQRADLGQDAVRERFDWIPHVGAIIRSVARVARLSTGPCRSRLARGNRSPAVNPQFLYLPVSWLVSRNQKSMQIVMTMRVGRRAGRRRESRPQSVGLGTSSV